MIKIHFLQLHQGLCVQESRVTYKSIEHETKWLLNEARIVEMKPRMLCPLTFVVLSNQQQSYNMGLVKSYTVK